MAMMEVGLNTLHVELSGSFSCVTAVRVKQMGTVLTCMLPTPPHLHNIFISSEGRYGGALLKVNTPRLTPIGLVSNLARCFHLDGGECLCVTPEHVQVSKLSCVLRDVVP